MSKTVSKLTFAAGIALAMAFTISCSSDDDGGGATIACKSTTRYFGLPIDGQGEVCEEMPEENESELDIYIEECESGGGGKYHDSCPSDYALKCPKKHNVTYYYYGNVFKGVNCEALPHSEDH